MNRLWKFKFSLINLMKWIPTYLRSFLPCQKPIHLMFCIADHFEPGAGDVSADEEMKRVDELLLRYPPLADRHKDFGRNLPVRTWFFPPHYHRNFNLNKLVSLCEKGYGEIELHLHHGKSMPDTAENLRNTINQCVNEYSKFGIFGNINEKKRYAFIHGDWALNNSRNNRYCGVNDEIEILNETGCYADFTFPSMNEANPKLVNTIFYPSAPYSGTGVCVCNKINKSDSLMIVQGPVHPLMINNNIMRLRVVGDSIDGQLNFSRRRIDLWIRSGIHVSGHRNVVFIKVHTHGATDSTVVLGKPFENILSCLESEYNDGERYVLHYVTARQMYNIIKALEHDEDTANPEEYRDYLIKAPVYDSSVNIAAATSTLRNLLRRTYPNV